jgi:hypothetical protein
MARVLQPTPPPYDPLLWLKQPFAARARAVCTAWALQGYGTPPAVYLLYALKVVLYVAGWVFFSSFSQSLGPVRTIASWWLEPVAFQKAIVWSLTFEILGLGCGSGPLTCRYFPPLGGALYFLRLGTTKLPLFPRLPLLGGTTRTATDVALYATLLVFAGCVLVADTPTVAQFFALALIVPIAGVADKTLFLAARAEHFWVTIVCFAFAPHWIAGAKDVQLALWFWAGFSKLNHHFPAVVCVMTSNGPLTRVERLRRWMYRAYPDDLRPSTLATTMAHAGTVLELGVPLAFLLTPLGTPPVFAIVVMLLLHGYITSNVPMGVPIEWNVAVVYGAFALFWAHPEVSPAAVDPALGVFLFTMLVAIPIFGNLFPKWVSFLLAMRYYAGNWACSVWLFRGDSYRKLARLRTSSPWFYDQLERLYSRPTAVGLMSKVMGFRLMHLHGRALADLVPKAVDDLPAYEWVDGELVAGLVLGWNFGEGHLHAEQLLTAVQKQCAFEPGELRCIFVEAQPLGRKSVAYRIADASTGRIEEGELLVRDLRARQPWMAA